MEVLADKVHKQGEYILQHCYISHNQLFRNLLFLLFFKKPLCCSSCLYTLLASSLISGRNVFFLLLLALFFNLLYYNQNVVVRCCPRTITLKTIKLKRTIPKEFPNCWLAVSNATLLVLKR